MQPQVITDDVLIGFVLADKYRVLRQIGRGGMGVVYEGEHVELGKRVAIKLMLEKYVQDGEATARFRREAVAASRIGNPHIIEVMDVGVASDGRMFVVMELLSGMPLSKVIEMTGPLPPWRAISIMRQVLRAVGAAHAKGIIHRDLKPDNIFVVNQDDHHDFVKLLDFGISKVIDPDEQVAFTKLTSTGVVMGTPLYMAPEQAMGQVIDRYADIYACGVILYEMLAGRPPFEGSTYAHLVAQLITQQPPLLTDKRPGLPGALVGAVHKALEKEPRDRFQTAEQFLLALPGEKTPSMIELAGTLDSSSGQVAVSPPSTTQKRAVRRKWPIVAMLAAAVAGAGVFTLVAMQQKDEPASSTALTPPAQPTLPVAPESMKAVADVKPIPPGTLNVVTKPDGATISINGQERGKAPFEITLAPGVYKVSATLDDHEIASEDVEIRENERLRLPISLEKKATRAVGSRPPKQDKVKPAETKTEPKTEPPTTEPPKTEPPKAEQKVDKPKSSGGTKPNPY